MMKERASIVGYEQARAITWARSLGVTVVAVVATRKARALQE